MGFLTPECMDSCGRHRPSVAHSDGEVEDDGDIGRVWRLTSGPACSVGWGLSHCQQSAIAAIRQNAGYNALNLAVEEPRSRQ